jgi:hypothetical protein
MHDFQLKVTREIETVMEREGVGESLLMKHKSHISRMACMVSREHLEAALKSVKFFIYQLLKHRGSRRENGVELFAC